MTMTTKSSARRPAYWDERTLHQFVEYEARNQGIKTWRDAYADDTVMASADQFEDDLIDALERWQRSNPNRFAMHPDGIPYQPQELLGEKGPYLAYMTITGTGVSIMDGEWDHFFVNPRRDLRDLANYLEKALAKHADEGKPGGLAGNIAEAAFVTSGEEERLQTEEAQEKALKGWQDEGEEALFGHKWAATREGNPRDNVTYMYEAYKEEEEFLAQHKETHKHLIKIKNVLAAYANKLDSSPYTSDVEYVIQAAENLKKWIKYYELVAFKFGEVRGALAGQVAYDLAKALPDWELDMAKWKKKITMVVVPLVKKNGRQIILKVKFPNIDNFEAQIGVPGSTVKFSQANNTKQIESFIRDAISFINQLIRLR